MASVRPIVVALILLGAVPAGECSAQAPAGSDSQPVAASQGAAAHEVTVLDKLVFRVDKASRTKQGTVKLEFTAKATASPVEVDDVAGAHGYCPQILLTDLEGMKEYYPMEAGATCLAGGPIKDAVNAAGGSFWLLYSGVPAATKAVSVRLARAGVLIPDVNIE